MMASTTESIMRQEWEWNSDKEEWIRQGIWSFVDHHIWKWNFYGSKASFVRCAAAVDGG